ncbi:MAG: cobalt-precorrin-5B (C(1))-methyltransferase CbiD [Desulfatitalea sp.]|nr:cobalt-precorrin-5B (C(1))-methyltransferase CbiD [Desulfatitalea sp.]
MAAKSRKRLRTGFTTGTAAAAATKAALRHRISGQTPGCVAVTLLTGDVLTLPVHRCETIAGGRSQCSIIKDAGDDPDVTHGAQIGARVDWQAQEGEMTVEITAGEGVGRVTKPGLEVAPGRPAINPGPQEMIRVAVAEVMRHHGVSGRVFTEIFVPRGVALARRTLNERLGIVGGISILGTSGIVRPLSHDAYVATIRAGLSVARAAGRRQVVLTTGRRSERFAQAHFGDPAGEGYVQMGDYFQRTMEMTAALGFQSVRLCVFFGKALKMAQGIAHTHARSARLSLERLAQWTLAATGDSVLAGQVAAANTARHAFELIQADHPQVIQRVGWEMVAAAEAFGGRRVRVDGIIFGFDGTVRYESGEHDA